jgi:RNA polymerase sigma-70 factor (ECF subfamily)
MALARAASGGDVLATRKLVEAVAPRMGGVVRVVLGGAHSDAEDVLQQALIAFVQALPRFRGECEPPHFASRVAVLTAMAARRRARNQRARHDDLVDPDMTPASSGPFKANAPFGERRKEAIRELLEQLPEEQAEALALRAVLGWTLEEIAATSGAPVNTVRSRMRLAKEAMRRRIEADPALKDLLEVEP